MEIIVNGKAFALESASSVHSMLLAMGFGERPVLVELNQEALLASEHETTILQEGDRVELIQIVAGG